MTPREFRSVHGLLDDMRSRAIELRLHDGRLQARGALTEGDRRAIRENAMLLHALLLFDGELVNDDACDS